MPEKKPSISANEFHAIESDLRKSLQDRLEDEAAPIGGSDVKLEGTDVWDGVVAINSKFVATELRPLVKKKLGDRFPLKFIKKGGYPSVKEALDHLMPQLRDWCVGATSASGITAN